MSDAVAWEGAVNARRVLGSVYRMGRREWLTERGWRQMRTDGVRTVIDLRNPDEQRRRPTDPDVGPEAMDGITIVNTPTEDPAHPEHAAQFAAELIPYLSHPKGYPGTVRLFPDLIAAVFRAIAEAPAGVVLHCSAGRDRTGLIVTMLLQLADPAAAPEAVAAQYEASVRGINEWHRVSPVKHPYERWHDDAELAPMIAERQEALAAFAAGLDVERFLLDHGLTAADIAAIRAKLAPTAA